MFCCIMVSFNMASHVIYFLFMVCRKFNWTASFMSDSVLLMLLTWYCRLLS
jgi:hypothetical protein